MWHLDKMSSKAKWANCFCFSHFFSNIFQFSKTSTARILTFSPLGLRNVCRSSGPDMFLMCFECVSDVPHSKHIRIISSSLHSPFSSVSSGPWERRWPSLVRELRQQSSLEPQMWQNAKLNAIDHNYNWPKMTQDPRWPKINLVPFDLDHSWKMLTSIRSSTFMNGRIRYHIFVIDFCPLGHSGSPAAGTPIGAATLTRSSEAKISMLCSL